jgi:hypothetical protein
MTNEIIPTNTILRQYTWERIYPLPSGEAYKTVNAAVADTISTLSRGNDPVRDETAGWTRYTITSIDGITFQLRVLHTSEKLATVRLSPVFPNDTVEFAMQYLQTNDLSKTGDQISELFRICDTQIKQQLRRAMSADEFDPLPPPKSDIDLLLTWQETYRPTMKDQELAEIAGIEAQSIRNARHRLNRTRRVERGKQSLK